MHIVYDPATDKTTVRHADEDDEDVPLRGLSRSLFLDGGGDPDALSHVRPFGGILSEVNSLRALPIEQSSRNSELLHFCEYL